jgi:hypothetical protein
MPPGSHGWKGTPPALLIALQGIVLPRALHTVSARRVRHPTQFARGTLRGTGGRHLPRLKSFWDGCPKIWIESPFYVMVLLFFDWETDNHEISAFSQYRARWAHEQNRSGKKKWTVRSTDH